MRSITRTFGPPGTGKTTEMLNKVEKHLQDGIHPSRIAFVSFTKKAVQEAAGRAAERFRIDARELVNFKTVHATAYHALNITRADVMDKADYKELSKMTGFKLNEYTDPTDGFSLSGGPAILSLMSYAQATGQSLRSVWEMVNGDTKWLEVEYVSETIRLYKEDLGKVDFGDMLLKFSRERPLVDVDAVIIDEAQDLSNTQWDVCKTAFRECKNVHIAGDDDQAIYGWSGANPERFLAINADTSVLSQSYRLPRSIYEAANKILNHISHRQEKTWSPRDEEGSVNYDNQIVLPTDTKESWLYLARNNYMLDDYKEKLMESGIPYTFAGKSSIDENHRLAIRLWTKRQKTKDVGMTDEEMDHVFQYTKCEDLTLDWYDALVDIPIHQRLYYRDVLSRGYKIGAVPNVTVSSIHGVKGGEADNVVLKTDMSYKSHRSMKINEDVENRVFYVGVTRARHNLHILEPQTDMAFPLLKWFL